jgi:rSAM/selenodomain-associated transferase 2
MPASENINSADKNLSIVVPVLNDGACLKKLLEQLTNFAGEIIVVDGGSSDDSVDIAQSLGATVIHSEAGRSRQMNRSAEAASRPVLLFLHSDSDLPQHFSALIEGAMRGNKFHWGRFDVRLSGKAPMLRIVEWMMNNRSALSGICTGDQGIFVKRDIFLQLGGFPQIELMEDIAFSKKMPRRPYRIRHKLVTSSRRWERNGVLKTIALMWLLRFRFFMGADPKLLAKQYGQAR